MNSLGYKTYDIKYHAGYNPVFDPIIDGEDVQFAFNPAALEYSYYNGGLMPIFICGSCGDNGCCGAYVAVLHKKGQIVWNTIYDSYGFDENEQEHRLEVLKSQNGKVFNTPLVFDRKQYKQTIDKMLSDPMFEGDEKKNYKCEKDILYKGYTTE